MNFCFETFFFKPPDIFDCERYSKRNATKAKREQKHTDTNSELNMFASFCLCMCVNKLSFIWKYDYIFDKIYILIAKNKVNVKNPKYYRLLVSGKVGAHTRDTETDRRLV